MGALGGPHPYAADPSRASCPAGSLDRRQHALGGEREQRLARDEPDSLLPADIYQDYATNHSKQNIEKYSTADLQAYLGDVAIHMYENGENPSVVADLDAVVTAILNERTQDTRGTFPFTGAELLVVVLGALALVAGGYGLRRAVGRG